MGQNSVIIAVPTYLGRKVAYCEVLVGPIQIHDPIASPSGMTAQGLNMSKEKAFVKFPSFYSTYKDSKIRTSVLHLHPLII